MFLYSVIRVWHCNFNGQNLYHASDDESNQNSNNFDKIYFAFKPATYLYVIMLLL